MNDCQAPEADSQSLEFVQPGNCSFDNPARLAKTAAVRVASTGDLGGYAGCVQGLAVLVVIVSAITLHDARLGQGAAAFAADRRNRGAPWRH